MVSDVDQEKAQLLLVKDGGLRGFSPIEIATIALVAGYHHPGCSLVRARA